MKRILACLLTAALALVLCAAAAEGGMTMVVVNCSEWVSLRSYPSTSAERLARVPLGEVVYDCVYAGEGFFRCTYEGDTGYILAQYLIQAEYGEPEEPGAYDDAQDGEAEIVLDAWESGLHVVAQRVYAGEGERLSVYCEEADGERLWSRDTATTFLTELTLTYAFIAGTAQDPMVMVYNAETGLSALDIISGEERWVITPDETSLGAGISWTSAGDGTLYIGGYYGPDPVAIGRGGEVLWKSDSQGSFWLNGMRLEEGVLVCDYDSMDDTGEHAGQILYSLDGELMDKIWN